MHTYLHFLKLFSQVVSLRHRANHTPLNLMGVAQDAIDVSVTDAVDHVGRRIMHSAEDSVRREPR
jgi:hypothetical protein